MNVRDPRSTAQAIFRKWLPLPDAILRMVVRNMPNPKQAQLLRINNLINKPPIDQSITSTSTSLTYKSKVLTKMNKIYKDISLCNINKNESDVMIFISKMTPIRVGDLSLNDLNMLKNQQLLTTMKNESNNSNNSQNEVNLCDPSAEVFMALGRVFSCVLTRDSILFVLGNRHDPLIQTNITTDLSDNDINETNETLIDYHAIPMHMNTVTQLSANSFGLYICLGPSFYPIDEVFAGNIVGIIGLQQQVFKTGTLTSTWASYPMKAITFQAKPMVRVALEPLSHNDLIKLENGLQSLYQYDPVVEVGIDDQGQHIMTCLGELHLELCLKTLIDKFAK